MASARRIGAADAKNRTVLLDAAEQLMLEEGYAAVSSRRVASKAGLKPQLVHYYFRSMDDLFLGVLRRRVEESLEQQARILDSDQPLRALWEFSTKSGAAALTMEFVALANHRKTIRAELARHAERFRAVEIDALSGVMQRHGISPDEYPPAAMAVLIASLSRVLMLERALGMSAGHAELLELIEQRLRTFDGDPKSADAARTLP
jgi:AcrR family transcriptional regulator